MHKQKLQGKSFLEEKDKAQALSGGIYKRPQDVEHEKECIQKDLSDFRNYCDAIIAVGQTKSATLKHAELEKKKKQQRDENMDVARGTSPYGSLTAPADSADFSGSQSQTFLKGTVGDGAMMWNDGPLSPGRAHQFDDVEHEANDEHRQDKPAEQTKLARQVAEVRRRLVALEEVSSVDSRYAEVATLMHLVDDYPYIAEFEHEEHLLVGHLANPLLTMPTLHKTYGARFEAANYAPGEIPESVVAEVHRGSNAGDLTSGGASPMASPRKQDNYLGSSWGRGSLSVRSGSGKPNRSGSGKPKKQGKSPVRHVLAQVSEQNRQLRQKGKGGQGKLDAMNAKRDATISKWRREVSNAMEEATHQATSILAQPGMRPPTPMVDPQELQIEQMVPLLQEERFIRNNNVKSVDKYVTDHNNLKNAARGGGVAGMAKAAKDGAVHLPTVQGFGGGGGTQQLVPTAGAGMVGGYTEDSVRHHSVTQSRDPLLDEQMQKSSRARRKEKRLKQEAAVKSLMPGSTCAFGSMDGANPFTASNSLPRTEQLSTFRMKTTNEGLLEMGGVTLNSMGRGTQHQTSESLATDFKRRLSQQRESHAGNEQRRAHKKSVVIVPTVDREDENGSEIPVMDDSKRRQSTILSSPSRVVEKKKIFGETDDGGHRQQTAVFQDRAIPQGPPSLLNERYGEHERTAERMDRLVAPMALRAAPGESAPALKNVIKKAVVYGENSDSPVAMNKKIQEQLQGVDDAMAVANLDHVSEAVDSTMELDTELEALVLALTQQQKGKPARRRAGSLSMSAAKPMAQKPRSFSIASPLAEGPNVADRIRSFPTPTMEDRTIVPAPKLPSRGFKKQSPPMLADPNPEGVSTPEIFDEVASPKFVQDWHLFELPKKFAARAEIYAAVVGAWSRRHALSTIANNENSKKMSTLFDTAGGELDNAGIPKGIRCCLSGVLMNEPVQVEVSLEGFLASNVIPSAPGMNPKVNDSPATTPRGATRTTGLRLLVNESALDEYIDLLGSRLPSEIPEPPTWTTLGPGSDFLAGLLQVLKISREERSDDEDDGHRAEDLATSWRRFLYVLARGGTVHSAAWSCAREVQEWLNSAVSTLQNEQEKEEDEVAPATQEEHLKPSGDRWGVGEDDKLKVHREELELISAQDMCQDLVEQAFLGAMLEVDEKAAARLERMAKATLVGTQDNVAFAPTALSATSGSGALTVEESMAIAKKKSSLATEALAHETGILVPVKWTESDPITMTRLSYRHDTKRRFPHFIVDVAPLVSQGKMHLLPLLADLLKRKERVRTLYTMSIQSARKLELDLATTASEIRRVQAKESRSAALAAAPTDASDSCGLDRGKLLAATKNYMLELESLEEKKRETSMQHQRSIMLLASCESHYYALHRCIFQLVRRIKHTNRVIARYNLFRQRRFEEWEHIYKLSLHALFSICTLIDSGAIRSSGKLPILYTLAAFVGTPPLDVVRNAEKHIQWSKSRLIEMGMSDPVSVCAQDDPKFRLVNENCDLHFDTSSPTPIPLLDLAGVIEEASVGINQGTQQGESGQPAGKKGQKLRVRKSLSLNMGSPLLAHSEFEDAEEAKLEAAADLSRIQSEQERVRALKLRSIQEGGGAALSALLHATSGDGNMTVGGDGGPTSLLRPVGSDRRIPWWHYNAPDTFFRTMEDPLGKEAAKMRKQKLRLALHREEQQYLRAQGRVVSPTDHAVPLPHQVQTHPGPDDTAKGLAPHPPQATSPPLAPGGPVAAGAVVYHHTPETLQKGPRYTHAVRVSPVRYRPGMDTDRGAPRSLSPQLVRLHQSHQHPDPNGVPGVNAGMHDFLRQKRDEGDQQRGRVNFSPLKVNQEPIKGKEMPQPVSSVKHQHRVDYGESQIQKLQERQKHIMDDDHPERQALPVPPQLPPTALCPELPKLRQQGDDDGRAMLPVPFDRAAAHIQATNRQMKRLFQGMPRPREIDLTEYGKRRMLLQQQQQNDFTQQPVRHQSFGPWQGQTARGFGGSSKPMHGPHSARQ